MEWALWALATALAGALGVWASLAMLRAAEAKAEAAAKAKLKAGEAMRVALITGANSGIGLALVHKLCDCKVRVVMGCRNKARAEAAKAQVVKRNPSADVHILIVNVSSHDDARDAAEKFAAKYHRLDFLFCNAGIFPTSYYNWGVLAKAVVTCRMRGFFATGRQDSSGPHFMGQPESHPDKSGTDPMFATHVYGHFALIQGLAKVMHKGSRVVWTGSRAASRAAFKACWKGHRKQLVSTDGYGASKYAVDLLNAAIEARAGETGVHSITTCPGYVDTHIAPPFFRMMSPFVKRMRFFVPSFQITPEQGANVLLQAAVADADTLRLGAKYVLNWGRLVPATFGADAVPEEDREEFYKSATAHCGL